MKKISENNKKQIETSPAHYVAGVVFIAFIAITLCFALKPIDERVLLENGTIEKTRLATAYVIKHESTVKKDLNKVLVPIIAEGSKTQKGGIIATYKGEEYRNYEEALAKMDGEILELMNDLPIIYSSEVEAIERIIYSCVKDSIGENSYAKMQEYKQKINTEINKRANIIGELSPAGAEIKELIAKRNAYEEQAKKSNDNILAPITGLVSYKTDGLESKLTANNINDLEYNEIELLVNESDLIDNTHIKVVNNYEAFVVTKIPLEDKAYLTDNHKYNLRLIENNNCELKGELVKTVEKEDGIEVYFKITNGVEELVDSREIEIEIIWWKSKGLVLDNRALVKYENIDSYFVYDIKYSEIVQVPVKIVKQNDRHCVVTNYTKDELDKLGIDSKYKLNLHDRIIIKENSR